MKYKIFTTLGITAVAGAIYFAPNPYPIHTLPSQGYGVADPTLTKEIICNKNWRTGSIRPNTNYTNKIKSEDLDDVTYTDKNAKDFELDHVISLTIGGSPRDPKNLYPEPYDINWKGYNVGARSKDRVENRLHSLVCNGTITLLQAQQEIKTDWVKAYIKYIGELPKYTTL